MPVRRNYGDLTTVERDRLVQALHHVKSTGIVDQFANEHATHFNHGIHRSSHFLPWHREFVRRFEAQLQTFHPEIAIPYWDSTVDTRSTDPLWANAFLGQFNAAWGLNRQLRVTTPRSVLPTPQRLQQTQQLGQYGPYWPDLERAIHDPPHNWVGGVMASAASPGDPVFYFHHCWIDFLWAEWQVRRGHAGPASFTASGPGLGLNDPLMGWPTTPADVLDHRSLGYDYDRLLPPFWGSIGGPPGGATSGLAATLNQPGGLVVFARGADSAVWHSWQEQINGDWSGWESLGGTWQDAPGAALYRDGRLNAFARGGDGLVRTRWQVTPNGDWSGGWESIGAPPGGVTSGLAATLNQPGGIVVFARGADGAVWHSWQEQINGDWSGWESLGGIATSGPGATLYQDGRLVVFLRGTDNTIWHRWQVTPNGDWSAGWESIGAPPGGAASGPAATLNQPGGLVAFARGQDGAVWHCWQEQMNGNWSGWESLGGAWQDAPGAGLYQDGRLNAFARDGNGVVHTRWQLTPNGNWVT